MEMLRTSRRTLLSAGLAAMLAIFPATATIAQAQPPAPKPAPLAVPITGTAPGNTIAGTFNIQRFARQNGALVAVGNVVATVTNTATGAVSTVVAPLAVPVDPTATTASCEILHLVLGPLDLNLLGLTVHLDQVVLDITAVPGAGNLLGNLLCAIAGLLNGPSPLTGLVTLLNNLLGALGTL
ncbi:MAG: hypothetical protein V7647_3895 [Acidobacteriota bacterium]|jgi:hypothetical protein